MAKEMSPSRPPALATEMPAHIARSHAAIRSTSSIEGGSPTCTDTAESACQPSRMQPASMDSRSPSRRILVASGMPCTTSSFTDAQMVAGKPRSAPRAP